jgi:hypothetical protein
MTQTMLVIVQSVHIKMIFKLIITVACLQATVISFAQSEVQKQMMYEHINSFSSPTLASIHPKPKPIPNKESLFSNAQIIPVYKIVFDKSNKPKLIQNNNYYLVFYIGRLYEFTDGRKSSFFKDSPIIKNITQFNLEKKEFKIAYITEIFSLDGKYLNPLIIDPEISTIIEREKTYTFSEFIDYKYGSMDKIKELEVLEKLRENLKVSDYYNFVKNDYTSFNYNCPKDTTLVFKTLINQIRVATKGFTTGQELKLLDRIKQKINPFQEAIKHFKSNLKHRISNDSIISIFKTKEQEYKKQMANIIGFYEYKIYDVSITNELLEILTNEQFNDYKKYIDIWKPFVESVLVSYNNRHRYSYGVEILVKEGVKNESDISTKEKILEDCGCPLDLTIEGRKKGFKLRR